MFFIFMVIFVLQAVWLYISELAGKDLDFGVILKFLTYVTPTLIPLILPLTILVSSIMVFGSFAENYEFAAMKSTGISLQRAMRGLSVFILILAIGVFFFANNVITVANFNFYNLRKNIAKEKPAMAIAAGQFNEIGTINIKVREKSGDRGQYLKDVIIHKKKAASQKNLTVIVAETGELISSVNSNILQLELKNGNYYDEIFSKDPKKNQKKPHAKSSFETYTINVDLEGLNEVDYEEKKIDSRYNMLTVSGLNYTIDSLAGRKDEKLNTFSTTLYNRSSIGTLNKNITPDKDTIYDGNIMDLFNTKQKANIISLALNSANSTNQILDSNKKSDSLEKKWLNQHKIALHEKFVLPLACIILFFVGAPLGALIRKGGIGLPMVVAVLLFLTYHFIGIFAKNSAKNDSFDPALATWLSTLIMLPLSVYLTNRATKDRGLFELDIILDPIRRLFSKRAKKRFINEDGIDYSYFQTLNEDKLIAVVQDPFQFEYDKSAQDIALHELRTRKVSFDTLEEKGINLNTKFSTSKKLFIDYSDYSKTALVSFAIGAILIVLHFVFKNNKMPQLADASRDLGIISFVIFAIYFVVSHYYYSEFYKSIDRKDKRMNPLLLFLSLPFYPIELLFNKFKAKQDFNKSFIENIE